MFDETLIASLGIHSRSSITRGAVQIDLHPVTLLSQVVRKRRSGNMQPAGLVTVDWAVQLYRLLSRPGQSMNVL